MGGRFVEGRLVEGRFVGRTFCSGGRFMEGRFVGRTFCSGGRFVEGRFVVVPQHTLHWVRSKKCKYLNTVHCCTHLKHYQ
jgi:hypothetical protein